MSKLHCVLCKKTHEHYHWKHRQWLEGKKDGWACGEWFNSRPHEFTTEDIKDGRKLYARELTQPYRDGQFSKEYRDFYPKQARGMVKEGVITQKQHDNAKRVWKGDL